MRRHTFPAGDDFSSTYAAEAFLDRCGISVGAMQAGAPRGLLFGEYDIAKWRNLNAMERAALHGTLTGRRGQPLVIQLFDDALPEAVAAFDREVAARSRAEAA